jgi:hypothetical protein
MAVGYRLGGTYRALETVRLHNRGSRRDLGDHHSQSLFLVAAKHTDAAFACVCVCAGVQALVLLRISLMV